MATVQRVAFTGTGAGRGQNVRDSRAIVAEGGQSITGVTSPHTDLVGQAVVCWEELLCDVCAICVLPIVASSKQEEACIWMANV